MDHQFEIYNDVEHLQFVERSAGEPAYMEYRYYHNDIAFMHTFVPPEKREKGIAGALAVFALEFARKENKMIMLYCPFMARYVKEHPGYDDLIDPQYLASNQGNK